jgi:radical SAM protein with 4Fe4S-binding SPASM domain
MLSRLGGDVLQPFFETPPKITLSLTERCNLACKHCYGDCNRGLRRELDTGQWLDFLDYLEANGVIQVYIEGGEPLFREDFETILRHCGRKMMTLLRTNGTLLDAARVARLKAAGIGRILVEVMGARAATHDYFTGRRGSHREAIAAVERSLAAGVETDMLIILNRRNAGELQDYVDLAHRIGVPRVGVLRLYPLGRARRRWRDLALSLEEQMSTLERLRVPDGLTLMQSWHPRNHNCCWQSAAVNAYGDSIGCMYLREYVNYGNILETPFLDTWHNDPLYKRLRGGTVEGNCSSCEGTQHTRGGCRSTAYAFHGRWEAPDPFCSTLNHGVDLRVLPRRSLRAGPRPAPSADS